MVISSPLLCQIQCQILTVSFLMPNLTSTGNCMPQHTSHLICIENWKVQEHYYCFTFWHSSEVKNGFKTMLFWHQHNRPIIQITKFFIPVSLERKRHEFINLSRTQEASYHSSRDSIIGRQLGRNVGTLRLRRGGSGHEPTRESLRFGHFDGEDSGLRRDGTEIQRGVVAFGPP